MQAGGRGRPASLADGARSSRRRVVRQALELHTGPEAPVAGVVAGRTGGRGQQQPARLALRELELQALRRALGGRLRRAETALQQRLLAALLGLRADDEV